MTVLLATIKKELVSYLFSPVAYVIAFLFYLYRGFEIQSLVNQAVAYSWDRDDFTAGYVFQGSSNLMILLVPPILTMRCFAEERRTGSLEVLLTAPVRDWEIVLGKWLAALFFFGLLWLPTLVLLWVLTWSPFLGMDLSFGTVLAGYLGLCLLGSMLLSVGCFTSSLTDNQLLASLCAIIFNYALLAAPGLVGPWLLEWAGDSYLARVILEQTNVFDHLTSWFGRGQIDSSKVVFYVSGTFFFLFLATRSLESRKWR